MKSVTFGFLFCVLLLGKVYGSPDNYEYDEINTEGEDFNEHEPVMDNRPSFNVAPQVFTPKIGDDVTLPCTSDEEPSDVLMFKKRTFANPGSPLLIFAGDTMIEQTQKDHIFKEGQVFKITNVKREDSAYYDCVYQYLGTLINVTHTIDVHYPPFIRPAHDSIEVTKGESATLNCTAKGNPAPTITWSRENGKMPSGAEEEQGFSITFENVDRHYGGSYTCTANNGVGKEAVATRDITVSYSPEIRTGNEMLHTGNGARVELVCFVHAHPAAIVSWTRDGEPVESVDTASEHNGGHRHLLTIEQVSDQDMGEYSCQAINDLGTTTEIINLTDAPSTPTITSDPHSSEEESYTLTWTTDSFYDITVFELEYRKTKANESTNEPGEWITVTETPEELEQEGVVRSFKQTLEDLQRATDYEASLSISNSVKPAVNNVDFTFSTRKALPSTPSPITINVDDKKAAAAVTEKEQAGQHQTINGSGRPGSVSFILQCIMTLVLTVIILPS